MTRQPVLPLVRQTEGQVKRDVRDVFERAGWKVFRLQAGTSWGGRTHYAEAGAPDLVCLAPTGRTVLVELKKQTGRLGAAQLDFQAWAHRMGHEYRVVRCVEDAACVLTQVRR